MRVTLYKGCILSDAYIEVFDVTKREDTESGISIFEDYLSTLEKRVFELDQVYVTNSGELNFELVLPQDYADIYEFNYMKVEYESIVRYCFVDNITLGNEIGVISYSEDIWHSYAHSMKIRDSIIVASRKLSYGEKQIKFYSPPIDYSGNNELQFEYLNTNTAWDLERNRKVLLFAKCDFYKGTSVLDTPVRETKIIVINGISGTNTIHEQNIIKYGLRKSNRYNYRF